jgi:uncharacterized protein
MSHHGSLLCLPSGVWTWPATSPDQIDEITLTQVFAEADEIGLFLLGIGKARWTMPDALHAKFGARKISVEVTYTGTAVSTYNILLGEGRRVAAGLIAVE